METELKDLLLIDELQNTNPELLSFLSPVSKVLIPYGFNPETKEVNFAIKLIEYIDSSKLLPYVEEIVKFKQPIKINEKSKKFCIFSILDYETGFDGRYSLLIDENRKCLIYREHFEGNELFKKFETIEEALSFISKKLYYYETNL